MRLFCAFRLMSIPCARALAAKVYTELRTRCELARLPDVRIVQAGHHLRRVGLLRSWAMRISGLPGYWACSMPRSSASASVRLMVLVSLPYSTSSRRSIERISEMSVSGFHHQGSSISVRSAFLAGAAGGCAASYASICLDALALTAEFSRPAGADDRPVHLCITTHGRLCEVSRHDCHGAEMFRRQAASTVFAGIVPMLAVPGSGQVGPILRTPHQTSRCGLLPLRLCFRRRLRTITQPPAHASNTCRGFHKPALFFKDIQQIPVALGLHFGIGDEPQRGAVDAVAYAVG